MNIKKVASLSLFLSALFILLIEFLYCFNFLPLSFINVFFIKLDLIYRWIYAFLGTYTIFFLLGLFFSFNKTIISKLSYQLIMMIIILILINLFLNIVGYDYIKMTFIGELSLFFAIIITFRTFFYSILYENLLE